MHPQLKLAAARHALDLATAEELIAAAHAGLDDGFYTYSLGELATQVEPSRDDSHRWFRAAVGELGIVVPGRDECISILIDDAVTRIVEGAESPRAVVGRLYADFKSLNFTDVLRKWADHKYRFADLEAVANGDYFLPAEESLDLDQILAGIVRHAWEWGRKRWAWAIESHWRSSTTVELATVIRDEQAFDRLPVLADAMQDAGCENRDVLDHLRYAGSHVMCCWVVEFLLDLHG